MTLLACMTDGKLENLTGGGLEEGIPGFYNKFSYIENPVLEIRTVNACQTIWRFMNSYETSRVVSRCVEVKRIRNSRSVRVRYLPIRQLAVKVNSRKLTSRPIET